MGRAAVRACNGGAVLIKPVIGKSEYKDMKVLITGGMGVMGAETSRRFVREGYRPIIFARHRDESLIPDILDQIDVELGDVLDMPRLLRCDQAAQGHACRACGGLRRRDVAANPALSIQVNVMGTVNVLEAARLFDVKRVVYTSAKGVYGPVLGEYGSPTTSRCPRTCPRTRSASTIVPSSWASMSASITRPTWASTWSCCVLPGPTAPARRRAMARWV